LKNYCFIDYPNLLGGIKVHSRILTKDVSSNILSLSPVDERNMGIRRNLPKDDQSNFSVEINHQ